MKWEQIETDEMFINWNIPLFSSILLLSTENKKKIYRK